MDQQRQSTYLACEKSLVTGRDPSLLSVVMMEPASKLSPGNEFHPTTPGPHSTAEGKQVRDAVKQELKQRRWRKDASWLVPPVWCRLFSVPLRTTCPRRYHQQCVGSSHINLRSRKKNGSTNFPTGQSGGGTLSFEVSSLPMSG